MYSRMNGISLSLSLYVKSVLAINFCLFTDHSILVTIAFEKIAQMVMKSLARQNSTNLLKQVCQ